MSVFAGLAWFFHRCDGLNSADSDDDRTFRYGYMLLGQYPPMGKALRFIVNSYIGFSQQKVVNACVTFFVVKSVSVSLIVFISQPYVGTLLFWVTKNVDQLHSVTTLAYLCTRSRTHLIHKQLNCFHSIAPHTTPSL